MYFTALLGNPVDHSISPVLFNSYAEQAGIEYAHLKIKVNSKKDLPQVLQSMAKLGFCGANITLPYKIEIIKNINSISPEAEKMGAVNTIVFKNNKISGYNTDGLGAIKAIERKLKKIGKNNKILILGAGGAARAIFYEIYKRTKNIEILNRDLKEAQKLVKDITGKNLIPIHILKIENLKKYIKESDYIINTTPVGMSPEENKRIVDLKIYNQIKNLKGKFYFDAIFNPYQTKFLKDAEKKGAKVCSGTYMMIYQAITAFELWTGFEVKEIDIEKINKRLIKVLH